MTDAAPLPIRAFEPDDLDRVNAFFDQMGGESRGFFNGNDGNRRWAMQYFQGNDAHTRRFMALDGERMVGYVFLWALDTMTPWLGIAVAEDYKGRHLGRQLLSHAEQFAKEHGKGGIFLTTHVANVRAQALYTRCGYRRLGMHESGEVLFFLSFPDTQKI